ncbi:MAG TPA: membrane dipeptidase [Ornithinimicrobium sp.]|uniref:membrane dipeptidase n=1 Tax=Ornithinimicrobium sp. TaxID=1977084 RepID=UPI002B475E85|nr:membrane dipeptidase [Ornithinimicrobium sp.]HKJ11079.1 membrane dipeptidase [Ornithinimicrobium sp.]
MSNTVHERAVVVDGLQINNWSRQILQELRAGGISGVNATCAVWEGPEETLRTIGDWCQLQAQNPDLMTLATSTGDIRQAKVDGRVAVLLGFQNASPFADDYRLVEVFSRLGVRISQLTYNIQNLLGGACYEPVDSGLTRYGRTIVSEMNRVGMLVDLSHVGNRTSLDAIDASAQPVSITHSNPTWYVDSPRNKPDDVIKALVERGGVIGCCLYPNVVGGAQATLTGFCRMVAELCETFGVQHVALGSDCTRDWGQDYVAWLRDGRWRPPDTAHPPTWPDWPGWFQGPADMPRVTEGLLEVGLPEDDVVRILGGNWLDLFDRVFPGAGGADDGPR